MAKGVELMGMCTSAAATDRTWRGELRRLHGNGPIPSSQFERAGIAMDVLTEMIATAVRRHQEGNLSEAEALYRRILERQPDHPGALHLLGVLAHQQGHDGRAVDLIARAIALRPDQASYHGNYGVALLGLGRLDEAGAALREALRLRPDHPDAHSNLGLVFHQQGHLALARACLEAALRLQPAQIDALFNLGNVLQELGHREEAIARYRRAHPLAPGRIDVLNNLGNALLACGRADEAIDSYRRALAIDPGYADAWLNLATALERQDRHQEAAECLTEVARLRPGEPLIALRRAALCPAVFPSTDAIARYRAELESTLDSFDGAGLPWDRDDVTTAGCNPSFNLAHHGDDDLTLRTKFAAVFRSPSPRPAARVHPGPPRIGFVVTHPHEGSFIRCTAGLLNQLTPGRFSIVICGSVHGIEALKRAIRHPDVTFIAFPDRLTGAIERIRAAACDLLYHWEVGTDTLNYFLPFARPAPVQCTSWGVQVTTGAPAIDYYVSSALVEVAEADAHYSEELVRLPCLLSYQQRTPRPDPPADRGEFGLPRSAHLYACLQRPLKLHPAFDPLLAGILRRDPHGLIVLLDGPSGVASAQVAERHEASMPDVADRIAWLPFQERRGYHHLLSLADVVLDPVPYGAGSSAYDVFLHDLPLVTLPGRYNAGRYVQACYRRIGFMDLVADTPEQYVEVAVRLGTDPDCRGETRARIARSSPVLFEDPDVVREHEAFFERAIAGSRSAAS
jgi:predicted O-linked N-acetylglucosamine transferase (SPINDLY family)